MSQQLEGAVHGDHMIDGRAICYVPTAEFQVNQLTD